MPEFSSHVISLFSKRAAAADQGGLLSGQDPSAFNTADPLRLWIIQVGIIVCTASLLSLALSKLRQPKVIAEVLGGIILGPTAFGRIPGFTQHVFPDDSRPYLTLVANIGLCLFLFLVGLEIDANVIKRNARLSITVSLAGMILPFGIGAGISHAVYKEFINPDIKFTYFMLFAGVAYSITAFPVLCRILTELKLLDTTVGIVVLSAGVGNDIVGWILLALSVALVNAGSGLTALYILLACVGWTIFLLFPVKMALRWLARTTGSTQNGPTVFFMTVTMLILFGSAFFTDVIGVHAIFGAFVAGVIVPREGGLAITMTEKLEDMVSIIFLPLYFTLSGLSTDLGLLNNGITWGYTIAIIVTAFIGKFGGCLIAAHYIAGFNWRESSTIGSLMSCKGLVELIVLNVGLSAGILSSRVFSMFVLEALVLTFTTTPLVTWLYPSHLRRRITANGVPFERVADDEAARKRLDAGHAEEGEFKMRFTVVLDKLEHLPGMMAFTQLIQPSPPAYKDRRESSSSSPNTGGNFPYFITTEALRLIELSDRVSAVMRGSVPDSLLLTDPVLAVFRMFGQLNGINVIPTISVAKFDELAYSVAEHARNFESDMILMPWLPPPAHDAEYQRSQQHQQQPQQQQPTSPSQGGPPSSAAQMVMSLPSPVTANPSSSPGSPKSPYNPFDILFRSSNFKSQGHSNYSHSHGANNSSAGGDKSNSNYPSVIHSQFVRGVFAQAKTDVALFVDQSMVDASSISSAIVGAGGHRGGGNNGGRGGNVNMGGAAQHVFLPFFGGPDDRLALEFVVQMCAANPKMRGTIVRVTKTESGVLPLVSGERGMGPEAIALTSPRPVHLSVGTAGTGGIEEVRIHEEEANALTVDSKDVGFPDTVYGHHNTEMRLQSDTADNIIWARYAPLTTTDIHSDSKSEEYSSSSSASSASSHSPSSHPQIMFKTLSTPVPLHAVIQAASDAARSASSAAKGGEAGRVGKLVVVTGRSRRLAVEDHRKELKELMEEQGRVGSEVRKTIGDVASAFVVTGVGSGVVVLQACMEG